MNDAMGYCHQLRHPASPHQNESPKGAMPMYAVTGITGQVRATVAHRSLLSRGPAGSRRGAGSRQGRGLGTARLRYRHSGSRGCGRPHRGFRGDARRLRDAAAGVRPDARLPRGQARFIETAARSASPRQTQKRSVALSTIGADAPQPNLLLDECAGPAGAGAVQPAASRSHLPACGLVHGKRRLDHRLGQKPGVIQSYLLPLGSSHPDDLGPTTLSRTAAARSLQERWVGLPRGRAGSRAGASSR